jgi:hypothetical protein
MSDIDDPMFAMILRFVGANQEIDFLDNRFIRNQLDIIQKYIEKFPAKERRLRAKEWIEENARLYRETWKKEIITNRYSNQRCKDCPLLGTTTYEHCQIHDQWVELLRQYALGDINTKKYVEDTLKFLGKHKEHLKVKLSDLRQ